MSTDNIRPSKHIYLSKQDMPSMCYECSLSTSCQKITHLPPDFNAHTRPTYCPIRELPYRKLRLVLNTDCNRNCEGCCNKDWNLNTLPICTDFIHYDTIMLTGGEPLLHPHNIMTAISEIRKNNPFAKIILYTASTKNLEEVLPSLDGLTFTLHTVDDVKAFLDFDRSPTLQRMNSLKSLRLNVFKEVGPLPDNLIGNWQIKSDIEWIKDCPLPENEILAKWHGCK